MINVISRKRQLAVHLMGRQDNDTLQVEKGQGNINETAFYNRDKQPFAFNKTDDIKELLSDIEFQVSSGKYESSD